MSVFSLNSLPSSTQCDTKVNEFFAIASSQSIMICVADMSVCTVSQVNYFRNAVDYSSMHDTTKLVILILHYPPELNILSKSCYHAIFLNRWDYIYIDSLGVTTGTDEGKKIKRVVLNFVETDQQTQNVEVDARSWIAKAFGLPVSTLSPETVKQAFKVTFSAKFTHYLGFVFSTVETVCKQTKNHHH
jgi:hypothetical protein